MTWHIDIERVSNGYILRSPTDYDDDGEVVRVITESDQTDAKVDAAVEMLYEVADYFGLLGSEYDRKRLSIGTQPGYAYEDTLADSEFGLEFGAGDNLYSEGEEGPNSEDAADTRENGRVLAALEDEAAEAILDALPEGWVLTTAQGLGKAWANAKAVGARQERERLRALLNEYEEWLIQQPIYGNGGGWGEAAMSKVWSLLADPEDEA